jgi:hypothetical protein
LGDPPEQGQRKDLLQTKHKLEEPESRGKNIHDIAEDEEVFGCIAKHSRFMTEYLNNYHEKHTPHNEPVEVTFVHGPAGTGKTQWVSEKEPSLYMVPAADGYKWHDGYQLHEAVLNDNLTPQNVSQSNLLIELDRYKVQVNVNNTFKWWKPKRIYITSVHEAHEITESFSVSHGFLRHITV